jgi:hypothetical protein
MMFLLFLVFDMTLVVVAQDRWAISRILLTVVVMYFVMQGRNMAILSAMIVIYPVKSKALNRYFAYKKRAYSQ